MVGTGSNKVGLSSTPIQLYVKSAYQYDLPTCSYVAKRLIIPTGVGANISFPRLVQKEKILWDPNESSLPDRSGQIRFANTRLPLELMRSMTPGSLQPERYYDTDPRRLLFTKS